MEKKSDEDEFDNMLETIFKDIEEQEFNDKKKEILKIKANVEEKMKKTTSSSERQMILMDMQRNNMEKFTGYAKKIEDEKNEFYKKHAGVIEDLKQTKIEKEALDIISEGMKNIEEKTLNSVARSESPGLSNMFKDLDMEQKEKGPKLKFDPEKVFKDGGKKKKTKQKRAKQTKRKTKKSKKN
tara:strand:+ start:10250 stop:10798 length:549 start_codon:yes stop_codon:yes gene_type:complete